MSITVSTLTKNIKGIDLYLEIHQNKNAKETFVLLHGFLSSSFSFRRLIPYLTEKFNVISIDLPPFGQSGKHSHYQYSYHNLAATVISLIDHLEYRSVYLIGHSMGGQIALNMMLQKPSLVKKGILLCSSGYLGAAKQSLRLLSYFPFFHYFVKRYLEKSGVKKNVENVVHNKMIIDDDMLKGYEQPFLNNEIFRGLSRMVRDREGDLTSDRLKAITTPCLLIWGEFDRVVPLHIGKRLAKEIPNAKLVVLKEAGHLIPEEKAEEVYQNIYQYINEKPVN